MWLISLVGCVGFFYLVVRARLDARAKTRAHQAYTEQLQLAQSENIPTTFFDLVKSVPAETDAAPLYCAAWQQMFALHLRSDPVLLNPEKTAQARKFVTLAAPGFALLDKAVALPQCRLAVADPYDTLASPALQHLGYLAKASVCEAELMAKDGHAVDALKLLGRRQMICTHLAQTPTSEGLFILPFCQDVFLRSIARILDAYGREPGVAQAASQAIQAVNPLPELVNEEEAMLVFELLLLSPKYLSDPPDDDPAPNTTPEIDPDITDTLRNFRLITKPGMRDRWRAVEIHYYRDLVAASRTGAATPVQLETTLNAISSSMSSAPDDDHAFARIVPDNDTYSQLYDYEVRSQSMSRVLRQACTTLEAWNATGKVPTALPGAGVEATDPFTNQPLHYSSTAAGFKIYGVGAQGVDHGGVLLKAPKDTMQSDVVFEFPGAHPGAATAGAKPRRAGRE
jgi:hypothetical protein